MGHRAAPSVTRCPRQETGPDDVIVGIVDAGRFGLNSRRREARRIAANAEAAGTARELSLIPLSAKGPPRSPLALPLRSATTPRGAVDRGRASAYRRRGRSLETVAPRMLRWSSFRMRQQEMMQDMK